MIEIKRLLVFLVILISTISCQTETEISNSGESAKLYYTPDCATVNGYITVNGNDKTYVFQHEIDEKFHETEIDVYIRYKIEKEPIPLTAECTQAQVIVITYLKER